MAQFVVLQVSDNDVVNGYAYTPTSLIVSTFGSANNSANTPWESVIVAYLATTRNNGTTSRYPSIPAGIQSQLDAGTLFEWAWSKDVDPNDTPQDKLATVKAHINAVEAASVGKIIKRLQYWGHVDDSAV